MSDVTGVARFAPDSRRRGAARRAVELGARLDRRFPRIPGLYLRIRYLGLHTFEVDARTVGSLVGVGSAGALVTMAKVPVLRRRPGLALTSGVLGLWSGLLVVDRLRWSRHGLTLRIPLARFADEVAEHLRSLGYEAEVHPRDDGAVVTTTVPVARVRAVSVALDGVLTELERGALVEREASTGPPG